MNIKSILAAALCLLATSFTLPVFANVMPIADAGPDLYLFDGGSVIADGSGSYDPDGDSLLYSWQHLSGPLVNINNGNIASPTITQSGAIPVGGALTVLQLRVYDGEFISADYLNVFLVDELPQVPVPAAVWLFGSGLLGLIGIARRKA